MPVSSGFRYVLAGSCAIALLFVALSLWRYLPQLEITWRQPGQSSAPAPAQAAQAPGRTAAAAQGRAGRAGSPPPAQAAQPAAGALAQGAAALAPPPAQQSAPGQAPPQPGAAQPGSKQRITVYPYPPNMPGIQVALVHADEPAHYAWLLTTANAVVRKRPGGDPFIAPSLSLAPLTVFTGSYVREVQRSEQWVQVLCPSRTLGWVPETSVKPVSM
jgi:hypothetical protein